MKSTLHNIYSHPFPSGLEYLVAHIIQDFMRYMRETGLSVPQIHALLYMFHSPDGECSLREIAELGDTSRAAVSQLVDRLVQQGLVKRLEDFSDRRQSRLGLTAKSMGIIEKGIRSNHFLAELMQSLTPAQRETVHAAFGILAQAGQRIQEKHTTLEHTHA